VFSEAGSKNYTLRPNKSEDWRELQIEFWTTETVVMKMLKLWKQIMSKRVLTYSSRGKWNDCWKTKRWIGQMRILTWMEWATNC
jgi:hypothetical protein